MLNRTKTVAVAATAALAITATTATASSLITSAKIADGAVHVRDLSRGLQTERTRNAKRIAALELKAGIPGPAGANGSNGTNGAAGSAGAKGAHGLDGSNGAKGDAGANGADGAPGANGTNGQNGADGADGQNGVNAATPVLKSTDAGWGFTGSPAAKLTGGELRIGGGFDANTISGAIGITKAFANLPLSSLSALSYSGTVYKRPGDVTGPTVHVSIVGAETGTASGFMNLVFEPANNGGMTVGQTRTFDALAGSWWGTRDTPGHARQATGSLASFVAANPGAKVVAVTVDNGGSSADTIPADAVSVGVDNLVIGFGGDFTRYDFGG